MTANAIMENYTYNLTRIVSTDIVNDPAKWTGAYNAELGGYIIAFFLAVLMVVLFILARRVDDIKDSKAAVYAGLITSVVALLLFFIEADGNKLITFDQLLIFLIITALAVLLDKTVFNY